MSLFSRISTFLRIRAHATLNQLEDPGQVMDYSYSKQLEQLEQLKRSIVDVVTNEKRLETQQRELVARVNKLLSKAAVALQANREDLARQALQKKEAILLQLSSYEQQIAQLRGQEEK